MPASGDNAVERSALALEVLAVALLFTVKSISGTRNGDNLSQQR
jgi:hypothetical protein